MRIGSSRPAWGHIVGLRKKEEEKEEKEEEEEEKMLFDIKRRGM